jgi:hypothetical protein
MLLHGHQTSFKNPINGVSKIVRMYADRGVNIRYVIFGHIHEANITDLWARGGSPVGGNAYSEKALVLTSRASQNCYIQFKDGNIDAIKIDLQEYDGYDGYNIHKKLSAYNAKSASKAQEQVEIFKVVI